MGAAPPQSKDSRKGTAATLPVETPVAVGVLAAPSSPFPLVPECEWRRSHLFGHHGSMIALILILILLAVTGVLGFVIKGLLWLGFVAVGLFVVALIVGLVRGRSVR